MESKKLYGASTQMTPAVYKDFYKTYYNEKLKRCLKSLPK